MNASTHFFSSGLDRYDHHPVLIAASSESAARRAAETVQQADLPLWAMPIEQALARFGKQSSATAFWLEVEADGPDLDPLLDRLDAEVGAGAFPAIIAAPGALIDPISARIRHSDIELLFDGSPTDRAAALAIAVARSSYQKNGVSEDITSEPSAARLRQLSDEVSRIASTLARLSVGPLPRLKSRSRRWAMRRTSRSKPFNR